MKSRGLTSPALSEALHRFEKYGTAIIADRNIQRWRSGQSVPNEGFIRRLSQFFGVNPTAFYTHTISAHSQNYDEFMFSMLREEAAEAFQQDDIFNGHRYSVLLARLTELQAFSGSTAARLAGETALSRASGAYLGLHDRSELTKNGGLWQGRRLLVILPVTMVAAVVLFNHINKLVPDSIDMRLNCCTGPDVAIEMKHGAPDLAVLPLGSAAHQISRQRLTDYRAVMLMPTGSYAIIGNAATGSRAPEGLLLVTERPSSALPYVEDIITKKEFPSRPLIHSESDEALSVLMREADALASAQWFPAYKLAHKRGLRILAQNLPTGANRHTLSTILFARSEIAANTLHIDQLTRMIRHAWLVLRSDETVRDKYVRELCERDDNYYLRALERCSGFLSPHTGVSAS